MSINYRFNNKNLSVHRKPGDESFYKSYTEAVEIDDNVTTGEFAALNPRNIKNILGYPTLLHYLCTLIICDNKIVEKIKDMNVNELIKFMNENSDNLYEGCMKLYGGIGKKVGDKTKFSHTTGLEYIVRFEVNTLQNILLKRPEFYEALKETRNDPIVYNPPAGLQDFFGFIRDTVPDVPDYMNINLVGELYEDIRKNMRTFTPMSVTSNIDVLPNIFKDWIKKKIVDVSTCLSHFYNYLSIDRQGFMKVSTTPTTTIEVASNINYSMIKYLLQDIFPCADVKHKYITTAVPLNIKNLIEDNIKTNKKTKIYSEVYQYIWDYVSALADIIYIGTNGDEKTIQDKITNMELNVMMKRITEKDWGFADETTNCCAQSFMYIIVTLTDWLEVDSVGVEEVETMSNIILRTVSRNDVDNLLWEKLWIDMFREKGLLIKPEAIKLLNSQLQLISNVNKNSENGLKMFNRTMFFSQII